jgi:plasmid stabilization system protein ParE
MRLRWTAGALTDLTRLHAFLSPVNERAAVRIVLALTEAAARLPDQPRIGRQLRQYHGREVRRTLVGQYELRYEVVDDAVIILRLWHTRESR